MGAAVCIACRVDIDAGGMFCERGVSKCSRDAFRG
jgi:hypothetical protein